MSNDCLTHAQTAEQVADDLGATIRFHKHWTLAQFRNDELAWQFKQWLAAQGGYHTHEGLPGTTARDVCYGR